MASATITTSAEDGYINNVGGALTVFKTGNDILVDTSSSSDAVTDDGHWFFNTINDGSGVLPAGAIIDVVSFTCHMNTSSPGLNFNGLIFYIVNNGPSLDVGDWRANRIRQFASEISPSVADFTYPLLVSDINTAGYTDISVQSSAGDANFGESFKYDAFEKAGGTPGRLNITYHLAGGFIPSLQLLGVGM